MEDTLLAAILTLVFGMLVQNLPDSRNNKEILMGKSTEAFGQHIDLTVDANVTIDDAAILIVNPAIAALGLDSSIPKTLFAYGDAKPFGQILHFLKQLIRFHP
jgi:hypothetical protein